MSYIRSNLRKFKWTNRFLSIAATATRLMLLPLFNILISKGLIGWKGETFWGEFYGDFLYVMLFAHIAGYGNKDFLLREISLNPKNAVHLWQESLANRSLLLLPMVLFFCWYKSDFYAAALLIGWTIATFLLQSFDVWVIYQKKFHQNLLIELSGFLLLIMGIYFQQKNISLFQLYILYFFITSWKVILFVFLFKKSLFAHISQFRLDFSFYFQKCYPFFLLAFGGMLASRADIYTLKMLVLPKELARYQVISNLYLQTQAVAGFIILPFSKNIYRFSQKQIMAVCGKLFLLGISIVTLATFCIYALIHYYYHLSFSWDCYLLSAFSCLPTYAYALLILSFYKKQKEKIILLSQFAAVLVIVLITYFFAPFWGIKAAFAANLIAQTGLCVFYFWENGR